MVVFPDTPALAKSYIEASGTFTASSISGFKLGTRLK